MSSTATCSAASSRRRRRGRVRAKRPRQIEHCSGSANAAARPRATKRVLGALRTFGRRRRGSTAALPALARRRVPCAAASRARRRRHRARARACVPLLGAAEPPPFGEGRVLRCAAQAQGRSPASVERRRRVPAGRHARHASIFAYVSDTDMGSRLQGSRRRRRPPAFPAYGGGDGSAAGPDAVGELPRRGAENQDVKVSKRALVRARAPSPGASTSRCPREARLDRVGAARPRGDERLGTAGEKNA